MPDYGQFCPVSRGAEIFAERWTPLILRELMNGSHRFSELQLGLPRISRNLLTQRLASLIAAGVIERRPLEHARGSSYHLTPAGEELRPVVQALGAWGYRWGGTNLPPGKLDPVAVDADLAALTAVWLGRVRLADAIAAGSIRLDGDDDARPRFSRWFGLSPFANGAAERILAGGAAR